MGGCSAGRLCPPSAPKHFRRMLPTQGWAPRDASPTTGRLEGLSSQVVASLAGTTRNSCKGWKDIGHRGAGGDPGWASTLQLPSVAICSHRRLPWTDGQGLPQRVLHAGL